MDKKKAIIIALIATVILILLFGGITLSNVTKKSENNKNTENVSETEDSNTVAGDSSDSQKEEVTSENSGNVNNEGIETPTEEADDSQNNNSDEAATPDSNEPTNQQSQEKEPSSESTSVVTKPKYTYTDLSKTMYAKSGVNVRDLPSTDGNKVGSLSKGQEVKVIGQCNETKWYRISLNGSTVYVSNNYLTDTKPQEETSSNTPSSETPSTPETPSQPSQPSTPDTPSASEHVAEKIYVNANIGDGLDKYRNGLHMYTDNGKYQLYVYTVWEGKTGYFFLSGEDDTEFGFAFWEKYNPPSTEYETGYKYDAGHSIYYETGVYEKINGEYYEYQFFAMYSFDENGNIVY